MDMPANCRSCGFSDDEARFCKAAKEYIPMLGKPGFCPLAELPSGHGRLIDADAMKRVWMGARIDGDIGMLLDARPTIVEAEGDN
jgi:hypothetical protein